MAFTEDDIRTNRDYFDRHLNSTKYKLDVINRLNGEYKRDPFLLLDVRSREGFAKGHIEGAHCFPASEVDTLLSQLPKDTELAVYCWSDT
jgi:rhodanese-related sulfurtransferase